jgi:predicted amidohydrolase YtcJ
MIKFGPVRTLLSILPFLTLLWACDGGGGGSSVSALADTTAYTLYHGGDIITMEGEEPAYVEALVEGGGVIAFVGSKADAVRKYPQAKAIDLQGHTLLPGFIDAHGHLFNAGVQALSANLLPPPDGEGTDIDALVRIAKDWMAANAAVVQRGGWVLGFGYDDAQLKERRHPTAKELDRISTELPVIFLHQSGHLAAVNSVGLQRVGYTKDSKDPVGGVIRRIPGTREPDGVLEESAMFLPMFKVFDGVDAKGNEAIARAGIAAYTSYGFTTAQEGRASADICNTFVRMATKGELPLDVDAYPDIQMAGDFLHANWVQRAYTNRFRIAGTKLNLDGSPQGKTAWLTKPYRKPPPGAGKDYVGYPAIPNEDDVLALVDTAFKHNWPLITHCNGDAAMDQYIRAVRRAAQAYGNDDRRTVMIHAQTVREDQLDSMKVLGIIPSFFSMHTFYWGDWHRDETLGPERAYRISPAMSAMRRSMRFTQHHDAPVAKPDALRVLWCTVNRVSRSGEVIGPDQRVSPYIALKSITEWAAWQGFTEDLKGTLAVGKYADLVVLDQNPLKVEPMAIQDIKVLETIKEGRTIYKR